MKNTSTYLSQRVFKIIIFLSGLKLVLCRAHPGGQWRKCKVSGYGYHRHQKQTNEQRFEGSDQTAQDALKQRYHKHSYERIVDW